MPKSNKRFASYLPPIGLAAFLSACGGGDTSSGGGASVTGTYSGPWNATLTGAGSMTNLGPGMIVVVINPNNTVVLDPNTPIPGRGTLSGNTITANYNAAFANTSGLACTGMIAVAGTVSGNTVTGTIGPSTFRCNGVPFTVRGRYTATKTARALLRDAPLSDAVRSQARPLAR